MKANRKRRGRAGSGENARKQAGCGGAGVADTWEEGFR
jgi:hypothetical protein